MQEFEGSAHFYSSGLPKPTSVQNQATQAPSESKDRVPWSAPGCHTESDRTCRIVIADDETIFRESLRMLLQMGNGFEVIGGSSDAVDTLEAVRRLKPDILLLDHSLPSEAGTDLLLELRKSETSAKVILLCQAISQDETIRALRMGVCGIVLKTEPTDCLTECIHKVMSGEYWLGKDSVRDLVQAVCSFSEAKRSGKNRFGLTPREIEIIQAVLEGYSNPEIAANFSLSEQTVKHHLSHIFDKLGVYSRLELALFAVNHDINSQ